jgi:LEA14-like dessication related protein
MNQKWIVIGSLLAVGGFLFWHFRNQARLLSEYTVKFSTTRIKRFSFEQAIVEVDLLVANKSDIDIVIESYEIDAYINNVYITKVVSKIPQKLNAKSESFLTLVLDFNPKMVLKSAINIDFAKGVMLDKSNVTISLRGKVTISHKGIKIRDLPINVDEKLS